MDTKGKYYLGRIFDPKEGKATDQPLLYSPDDLTTHGFVVGMTGSGKTGLCIGLLEEVALSGLPALMIDPKGDITNTLLHFPDLLPQDFQPWVNPDLARRQGKTVEQTAAETAEQWKQGLADWGITPERILALKNAAQFAIFTPGSDAGIPVSILASLKAPGIAWDANRELLREKISGTVTAILGLVGMQDIDPVRSREHILLSNIFENAWKQNRDLDLGELILQTQNPPFPKLGVFDVNTFFPEEDRFGLAMLLNNILASPSFQSWVEGEPLNIASLLYTPDGRPRHSVFYIAHLTDAERMFFVSLLYSAVESWMRAQTGTSSLRMLLYFDEIFGYLPPIANPPCKQTMLRMLKQARAFGVGQVLVTQNPVDVDYKALSNAGTWCIGKLQTDQDKQRLLDGLESAMAGGLNRQEYDRLISSLGKRVFLLHNVNAKAPALFQTRWVMNYLAGPLTRTQIPPLNQLAGAVQAPSPAVTPTASAAQAKPDLGQLQPVPVAPSAPPQPAPAPARPTVGEQPSLSFSTTRPTIPAGVSEFFLPNNLSFTQAFQAAGREIPTEASSQGLVYRPVLLAQSSTRFINRKYDLDYDLVQTTLVQTPDRRGLVRWENYSVPALDQATLDQPPDPQGKFATLEAPFSDGKALAALQKDFLDWAYRTAKVIVRAHEGLGLYAGPQVSAAEFRTQCSEAARAVRDEEIEKFKASFETKLRTMQDRLKREERELRQDESELSQRKMEETGTHLENIASLLGMGRKRTMTTSLTKRRQTAQAKADVEESQDAIEEMKKQMAAIEEQKTMGIEQINQRVGEMIKEITEIPVTPLKKDVLLDFFGVAWMPFYIVRIGDSVEELPGYSTG
jgi:hypothetical protein